LATPFLQHLGEAGWSRDGVDAVVCTHLHVDHVGWGTMLENCKWAPTFRRGATSSVGARTTSGPTTTKQQAMLGDSVKPIFDAGLAPPGELDHVISPEIRLTPSIGHTPGQRQSDDRVRGRGAVTTGDRAHHPCQMTHPDWSLGDNDPKAAALTR
jgi:glyoxylase-like metal-dependent hydrolase (beta-lactamase superfamily II)